MTVRNKFTSQKPDPCLKNDAKDRYAKETSFPTCKIRFRTYQKRFDSTEGLARDRTDPVAELFFTTKPVQNSIVDAKTFPMEQTTWRNTRD